MRAARLQREIPWGPVVLSAPGFISLLLREVGREGEDTKLQKKSPQRVCRGGGWGVSLTHPQIILLIFFLPVVSAIVIYLFISSLEAAFLCCPPFRNVP